MERGGVLSRQRLLTASLRPRSGDRQGRRHHRHLRWFPEDQLQHPIDASLADAERFADGASPHALRSRNSRACEGQAFFVGSQHGRH